MEVKPDFPYGYQGYPKLRQVMRKSDCKVKFMRGKGFPFPDEKSHPEKQRVFSGDDRFPAMYICTFQYGMGHRGSRCQTLATEHAIRKELDKMGVKIGKVQFFC